MQARNARLARLPEILERIGISRSSLHNLIKAGLWCPPIRIGSRCVGFISYEIDELLKAHIRGSSPTEIRELVQKLLADRKEGI